MNSTLESIIFRANPLYEAVPFNRLERAEREVLVPWQEPKDSFGVLIPNPEANLPVTAINRDTARLFFTMQQPGPLPDYLLQMPPAQQKKAVSALLLDNVLEIQGPQGFLGGSDALPVIGLDSQLAGTKLSQLSYAAIKYGQELTNLDPATLSFKLYFYNRLPATRAWSQRLPDKTAVLHFLDILPGQKNDASIREFWTLAKGNEAWIPFVAKRVRRSFHQKSYKLYISPRLEALPEIFPIISEILGSCGAIQFKVGSDCYGLLRPDKLVAYFTNKQDLFEAAAALNTKLAGAPVHGVPFTAETAADGLISWGIDPRGMSDVEGRSWRHWVTNRLAAGLLMARNQTASTVEPWRFALERLGLEGVDTATFMPESSWTGEYEP